MPINFQPECSSNLMILSKRKNGYSMIIVTAFFLIALLLPQDALAWGGGIHLLVGARVLGNLSAFPPLIASILAANPYDFLYGCIAADITVGKKFTHYMLNCHRWAIGRKVLQSAASDSEKACAYGYLSHLAADCIAHNYYVPYKIMRSFPTITMKHTYWEMRFETFVEKEIWDKAREVCSTDQRGNDAMMRRVVAPTLFSFGTNKRIFNSIMLLSRLEKWQKVMQTLSDNSRYLLGEEDRIEYLQLTEAAVFGFLGDDAAAAILKLDPTGERALAAAEALRKNLRLLYKSGRLTREEGFEQVEAVREKLRQSLDRPELLRDLHTG